MGTVSDKPWGKCQDTARHPLVDHCLDVAIVLRALLDTGNLGRLGLAEALRETTGRYNRRAKMKSPAGFPAELDTGCSPLL